MKVRVSVDVFSGRPNPVVVLRDAEARELLDRLRPAGRRGGPQSTLPPPPHESTLGYRGLVVEQEDETVRGLPRSFRVLHGELVDAGVRGGARLADEGFEEYFAGPDGPLRAVARPRAASARGGRDCPLARRAGRRAAAQEAPKPPAATASARR